MPVEEVIVGRWTSLFEAHYLSDSHRTPPRYLAAFPPYTQSCVHSPITNPLKILVGVFGSLLSLSCNQAGPAIIGLDSTCTGCVLALMPRIDFTTTGQSSDSTRLNFTIGLGHVEMSVTAIIR